MRRGRDIIFGEGRRYSVALGASQQKEAARTQAMVDIARSNQHSNLRATRKTKRRFP
jgi:hypothetical protein